ncbi:hypothetical protein GGR42_001508 [Saonia flava]|uniref:Histidine kinase n=1 Tax=Saonia flava TaxID=523696 RepID=A0A846QPS0_9FLAO|nr:FIST N-terminal domain-containing protein [Saonia flava]NJB71046.1 hypothetical protein [Saonia flava]
MKILQAKRKSKNDWIFTSKKEPLQKPLVLVFGNRHAFEKNKIHDEVVSLFPDGHIVYGSTSGEILEDSVYDGSIVLTAIQFEKSNFIINRENVLSFDNDIRALGNALMKGLSLDDLKHVLVISEGSSVNGSTLIDAIEEIVDKEVSISGGLCGDDARFEKTLASYNEEPKIGEVIVIGFYGDTLEITAANYGGWTGFGPERVVTKSEGNILYEIDGQPALDLYKTYLGDKANDLPQAALLYPLKVWSKIDEEPIVRTILNIDEEQNSMILAGDVPQESRVQLMMATVDDIVEGASEAAKYAMRDRKNNPELAILVSCVGRKLVMDQRTEEEIEEVSHTIGADAKITGFYSYGEIAPFAGQSKCQLHNQTMTLTLFSE